MVRVIPNCTSTLQSRLKGNIVIIRMIRDGCGRATIRKSRKQCNQWCLAILLENILD